MIERRDPQYEFIRKMKSKHILLFLTHNTGPESALKCCQATGRCCLYGIHVDTYARSCMSVNIVFLQFSLFWYS